MPLAVPFFSGLASAISSSTIFLIASMSEGVGEAGGVGGWLEGRGRAGPPRPPFIGGVGAAILPRSGVQGLRGLVVGATVGGVGWLVGPCASVRVFQRVCGTLTALLSRAHCGHATDRAGVQVV